MRISLPIQLPLATYLRQQPWIIDINQQHTVGLANRIDDQFPTRVRDDVGEDINYSSAAESSRWQHARQGLR
jgi:hypothetical protein